MKLDLTREKYKSLEDASDTLADLIFFRLEKRNDLLEKLHGSHGAHAIYLNEQIVELNSELGLLNDAKHCIERLIY